LINSTQLGKVDCNDLAPVGRALDTMIGAPLLASVRADERAATPEVGS
jgi:hypothetical protein